MMQQMTLREMVGQLVMAPFYGENPASTRKAYKDYVRLVAPPAKGGLGVGGLILLNRVQRGVVQRAEPYAVAAFLNRMQKLAKVPLVVGGDFERSASMRVNLPAVFPPAMAFGAVDDLALTRAFGAATARESRALGVHWVFAPVADVNNNPENPIINTRSFGEDPAKVAAHVKAFIEGARTAGKNQVLLTVKHFPGHGDTATDTHLGLAKIEASRERLEEVELAPFRAAIEAGVDGVMMGHLAVPAVEEEEIPATLSAKVMDRLLRRELGFGGLLVTDALDMRGLTSQYAAGEAAVKALAAGAQVLMVPADPVAAIRGVVEAVEKGKLPASRVHNAVAALLAAKQRLGLLKSRYISLENVSEQIDAPELAELAQKASERALATLKNEGGVLPLGKPGEACWVVLQQNPAAPVGQRLLEEAQARAPKLRHWTIHARLSEEERAEALEEMGNCGKTVVASFVTVSSFRGDVALPEALAGFVKALEERGAPLVVVALGSPYVLRGFPGAQGHVATFSSTTASEAAVVRGLWGEVVMGAKAPVSVYQ
ncbi:MAG: hypothetical protein OHK0021_12510 [Bryobacter sp.]